VKISNIVGCCDSYNMHYNETIETLTIKIGELQSSALELSTKVNELEIELSKFKFIYLIFDITISALTVFYFIIKIIYICCKKDVVVLNSSQSSEVVIPYAVNSIVRKYVERQNKERKKPKDPAEYRESSREYMDMNNPQPVNDERRCLQENPSSSSTSNLSA
jgi:hypothetical protein